MYFLAGFVRRTQRKSYRIQTKTEDREPVAKRPVRTDQWVDKSLKRSGQRLQNHGASASNETTEMA